MTGTYVKHHGIKGQRWGVRRDTPGGSSADTAARNQKSINNFKSAKTISNSTNELVGIAGKSNSKTISKKNNAKIKDDLSKMSDQDLQKAINRMNMEERYSQVMNSRATSSGRDRVNRVLETAGTALAVTSSALTIAIALKELKK